jgi:hypothetical protein
LWVTLVGKGVIIILTRMTMSGRAVC